MAGELGGNGFNAAFAGGMVLGRITPSGGEHILDFAEDEGELLNLAVFFIFGVAALDFLDFLTWEIALFGLLSLTVIRMLPVAVSLLGTGLRLDSIAFIAWFGPQGARDGGTSGDPHQGQGPRADVAEAMRGPRLR